MRRQAGCLKVFFFADVEMVISGGPSICGLIDRFRQLHDPSFVASGYRAVLMNLLLENMTQKKDNAGHL